MNVNELGKQIITVSASNTEDENTPFDYESDIRIKKKNDKAFFSAEDSDISYQEKETPAVIPQTKKQNPHLIYSKYDDKAKKVSKLQDKNALIANQKKQKLKEDQYRIQIAKLSQDIHDAKKTILELKQDKLTLQEENGYIRLEKEKLTKIKDTEINILNEKLSNFEIQNKKLSSINEANANKIEEFTPKVWKYDELHEKNQKVIKDYEVLLENNSSLNNLLLSIKKENGDLTSKYDTLKLENESLKQDRMFLNKTSLGQDEKLKTANEKIKQLEEDIREMRKINQTYIDKLTDKTINLDMTYKDKVNSELSNMKIKYEKDIETLRKHYDDITDKKTGYLTEERDDYKAKATRYEKTIKEKKESIEFISNELRSLNKKTDEELSYLKLQVNVKTEELTRLKNLSEENYACLSLLKNENDLLKEKNDILRSELIKKESDYRTDYSEMKAQISILKEKLSSYDQMENELDKVICDSTVFANDDKSNDVIGIIKDIPTSAKRRISQCLVLANKIKLMTIEIEQLKDLNKKLESELALTKEERELYRKVTDKAKQPYSYLLKSIQDNELEIYKLKLEDAQKEQSIQRLIRENSLLEERSNGLESDLKTIVNNRQKLNNLESVITNFIQNDTNKGNGSSLDYSNANYNYAGMTKSINASINANSMMNNPSLSLNQQHKNTCGTSINNNTTTTSNQMQMQKPERDINTSGTISKVPNWYMKLKGSK